MSIGATEHHGDDPRTDHYEQSQHFDDEFDDYEAHDDDGVSEHDHLPDHHGSLNNDEQQQDTEGYSEFDHRRDERYDSIGDDDPEASAEWSENGDEETGRLQQGRRVRQHSCRRLHRLEYYSGSENICELQSPACLHG